MINKFFNRREVGRRSNPVRYFIHIPKTAGTSLRKALEKRYNVISDYSLKQPATSDLVRKHIYLNEDFFQFKLELNKIENCILSGHMAASKYAYLVGLENCVTILRDPAKRLVSHYKHQVRQNDCKESFDEFISRKGNVNNMSKLISLEDLHAIGLVGTTENYEDSVKLLNNQWNSDVPVLKRNVAPNATDNSLHDATNFSSYIKKIKEMNEKDFKLYESACNILENSRYFLQNKLPDRRAYFDVKDDLKTVIGWGFLVLENEPLKLKLEVNGKIVSDFECKLFRLNLKGRGYPREGYIGFKINTDLKFGDTVKAIDFHTNVVLFERVVEREKVA